MSFLKWFVREIHTASARNATVAPTSLPTTTSETTIELEPEQARIDFDCVSAFEYYNILRQEEAVNWCEWHLNITQNKNAIKTVKKFHQAFDKLELSSSIKNQIDVINKTFLVHMPQNATWNAIRELFKEARKNDNPFLILTAYTKSQELTSRLNQDSAANTYHALKLYCTLVSCPILSRTQDYTEAFTKIFFHPKVQEFRAQARTVYRGFAVKNKKFVANYKKDAIIITTTFLSTSTDRDVAEMFCARSSEDEISVLCTYKLDPTRHRTALDLRKTTYFKGEAEILILRYMAFRIESIERRPDNRRIDIYFIQCDDDGNTE